MPTTAIGLPSEALVFLPRTGTANWSSGADEGDGKARQGDGGCGEMVILWDNLQESPIFSGKIYGFL